MTRKTSLDIFSTGTIFPPNILVCIWLNLYMKTSWTWRANSTRNGILQLNKVYHLLSMYYSSDLLFKSTPGKTYSGEFILVQVVLGFELLNLPGWWFFKSISFSQPSSSISCIPLSLLCYSVKITTLIDRSHLESTLHRRVLVNLSRLSWPSLSEGREAEKASLGLGLCSGNITACPSSRWFCCR